MTVISEYRKAVVDGIGAPYMASNGNQSNVGAQVRTQWFSLVPRVPDQYVLGALVTVQTVVNAASGTASSVSGAVQLDAQLLNAFVAPAGGTAPRSYALSRLAIQEMERLTLGYEAVGTTYYGTAIASIASGSSATYTNTVFVPVGGPAAAISFQTQPTTNAFGGTAPTFTSQFWVRSVTGTNDTVITFEDTFTNSLSSGATIPITNYFPVDISPDMMGFIGNSVTDVQGLTVTGNDGSFIVDVNTSETQSLVNIQNYLGGANAKSTTLWFDLHRQQVHSATANIGTAKAYELMFVEFADGYSAAPKTPPATPAAPPASKNTGKTLPGQVVVPTKAKVAGRAPPARRF